MVKDIVLSLLKHLAISIHGVSGCWLLLISHLNITGNECQSHANKHGWRIIHDLGSIQDPNLLEKGNDYEEKKIKIKDRYKKVSSALKKRFY